MGANQFVSFPAVPAGARGAQAAIDLVTLVPTGGLDADLTFILSSGDFVGDIAVEGSIDGSDWSNLCQFDVDVEQSSTTDVTGTTPTKTFSPIQVDDTIVRFLRLNVSGAATVRSTTIVAVAAQQNCPCDGPGTNTFVTLPLVPKGASGPQLATDVSALDSHMTFICTGTFEGDISIQGSPDGNTWSVLCQFDASKAAGAGGLLAPIEVVSVVKFVKVFVGSVVTSDVTISVASEANCDCGTICSGVNSFLPFPVIAQGVTGPQASIDLVTLVPTTGLNKDLTFICSGIFKGVVAVEGSIDGTDWSVLCQFESPGYGATPGSFSPQMVENMIVRYLRTLVYGDVQVATNVSVSGQQNCDCQSTPPPSDITFSSLTLTDTAYYVTPKTFTLTGASASAIILAQWWVDFSLIPDDNVSLFVGVESQHVSGAVHVFPLYGVFIQPDGDIPPGNLFTIIPADVEAVTGVPVDTAFHGYDGSVTIVNPKAKRQVLFAVDPSSFTTQGIGPSNYAWRSVLVDIQGV